MKQLIIFCLFSLFVFSCVEPCESTGIDANCICTQQFDPVCGCDNVTYGNACMAECAGIFDFSEGPCF